MPPILLIFGISDIYKIISKGHLNNCLRLAARPSQNPEEEEPDCQCVIEGCSEPEPPESQEGQQAFHIYRGIYPGSIPFNMIILGNRRY